MKIIAVDNFVDDSNRRNIPDQLIMENVDDCDGEMIEDTLNTYRSMEDTEWVYKAVPNDYVLSKGMEDLV